MDNFELPKWQISDESGGSLAGRSNDGLGEVAMTLYGEMMCEVLSKGELMVMFAGLGLTCLYMENGQLGSVSIELSSFLDVQFRGGALKPEDSGGLMELLNYLKATRQAVFLTAYPGFGEFETQMIDADGVVVSQQVFRDLDFTQGIYGVVTVNEVDVAYQFSNSPDEMTVGIGQNSYDKKLLAIILNRDLDYSAEVVAKDGKRFQRLARKIILN